MFLSVKEKRSNCIVLKNNQNQEILAETNAMLCPWPGREQGVGFDRSDLPWTENFDVWQRLRLFNSKLYGLLKLKWIICSCLGVDCDFLGGKILLSHPVLFPLPYPPSTCITLIAASEHDRCNCNETSRTKFAGKQCVSWILIEEDFHEISKKRS